MNRFVRPSDTVQTLRSFINSSAEYACITRCVRHGCGVFFFFFQPGGNYLLILVRLQQRWYLNDPSAIYLLQINRPSQSRSFDFGDKKIGCGDDCQSNELTLTTLFWPLTGQRSLECPINEMIPEPNRNNSIRFKKTAWKQIQMTDSVAPTKWFL